MDRENFEIVRVPFVGEVSAIGWSEGDCWFTVGNEQVILLDDHAQDCCEHVYIDWEQIDLHIAQIKKEGPYTKLVIKGVPDMGILLVFEQERGFAVKVFIPAYNSQNGYYSCNLTLIVKQGGEEKKFDVSEFKEDHID